MIWVGGTIAAISQFAKKDNNENLTFSLLCILFLGCGNLKKITHLQLKQVDSTTVIHNNLGIVAKKDSLSKQIDKILSLHDSTAEKQDDIIMWFSNDTTMPTGPVNIQHNEDGSITVDPGGRKLDKLQQSSKVFDRVKDSTAGLNKSIVSVNHFDSSYSNHSDSTHKGDIQETKNTSVKMLSQWRVVFWIVVIITIIAGLIFMYLHYSGKIKQVINKI